MTLRARAVCVGLLLGALGCNAVPPHPTCVPDVDGGEFITSLGLAPGDQLPSRGDAGLIVPLHVTASIDCLYGGANAFVSTSNGSLDGLRTGVQETLPLEQVGADGAGDLQGTTTLVLPEYASARVSVTLDDASYFAFVTASLDAGVTIYEGTFTP